MPVVFVAFLSHPSVFTSLPSHCSKLCQCCIFFSLSTFFFFKEIALNGKYISNLQFKQLHSLHSTAENAWFTNVWGMFAEDCSAKSKSAYLSSSVSFFSRCRRPHNRRAFRLFQGRNNRLLDQRTLNCRIESFVTSVVIKNVSQPVISQKKAVCTPSVVEDKSVWSQSWLFFQLTRQKHIALNLTRTHTYRHKITISLSLQPQIKGFEMGIWDLSCISMTSLNSRVTWCNYQLKH